MSIFSIVLLILFGLLFLVVELVLLPGVSIGALLSLACYGGAVWGVYTTYGFTAAALVLGVIVLLSAVATVISLRAKTWQALSLQQEIRSSSMPCPQEELKQGDRGITRSRLSPMGKVEINGHIYEAKSLDVYVDPQTEIEVVGFENFNVIVKTIN